MLIFRSIEGVRIIFITGILIALVVLFLFSTCRWIPVARITKGLMKYKFFRFTYKYHAYAWWAFWILVIIHMIFAIGYVGFPF